LRIEACLERPPPDEEQWYTSATLFAAFDRQKTSGPAVRGLAGGKRLNVDSSQPESDRVGGDSTRRIAGTMAVQFAVLASGSRGNSTWLCASGAGVLIDIGIGPRTTAGRLAEVSAHWERVSAVLLTHTHGDHVSDQAMRFMARHSIPLFCHEGHRPALASCAGFEKLDARGLVRSYDERPFLAPNGMHVEAVELLHDGGPTFGFRIEAKLERSKTIAVGYLADTGCWSETMADAMTDVDLLGVEFNHDVDMQRRSGRSPLLIARNLGDGGHLSNDQGAGFLAAVLGRSRQGSVRDVVLLHLSQQCNRPELALASAIGALRDLGWRSTLEAARQDIAHPNVVLQAKRRHGPPAQGARVRRSPGNAA
jgi:phosphoribosyl 1,2-cyclic phosphodiesterase